MHRTEKLGFWTALLVAFIVPLNSLAAEPQGNNAHQVPVPLSYIRVVGLPLSLADKPALRMLWEAVKNTSSPLKAAAEQLERDGWVFAQIDELFDDVFDEKLSKQVLGSYGLALTDANLEPTYPVPGGQAPAFLLPIQAKHSGSPKTHSYADIMFGSPTRSAISAEAERLIRAYCLYKACRDHYAALRMRQLHQNQQNTADSDRLQMLKENSERARVELAEVVGQSAVNQLDSDLDARKTN